MVAAGMSGSMAETPRKSVGLGFDSRHVINFPFLSNLVSCTGEHLATKQQRKAISNVLSGRDIVFVFQLEGLPSPFAPLRRLFGTV